MARVIQVSFDELSQELFDWVVKQDKKPLSWLGREAFECFYQVQSHAAAADLSWQEWIEQAKNAVVIIEMQYDSIADAMARNHELFPESEE